MRLELNTLMIRDIHFADKTIVSDGVLRINRDELQKLLLEDPRFRRIDVELAHPGEKCRILQVVDVIEPRAKTSPGDEDFPGVVGGQVPVGRGSTCVLGGTAVVLSDYRERREVGKSTDPSGDIIDMWGPGADASIFGKTHNIVLLPTPSDGVNTHAYMAALKIAGLKTASYLARAGKGITPDATEVFELPPLTEVKDGFERLPRVVYIFQILTLQFDPIPGEPVLYGRNVPDLVPALIHPNEVFDGALTSPMPTLHVQTYQIQNHPIIKELYKRHGKDLCFAGVIVTTAPNNMTEIERIANMAASLAKYTVGADGAVLTKIGGGAPELTLAKTAQLCERLGIKTAIATLHMAADISDPKYGATTIFSMPEVDAIVSMGAPFMRLTLPPVERIIGRAGVSAEGAPVNGEMVRATNYIKGTHCQIGGSRFKAVRY
ncbi:MAG TPA: glycine/sarcosine/betaine reductase component B subunit [Syntrophorhabdales bacterium]|nr:glycine/sarcosine/betaine reductase component B subunit [Syntrophorhabdales bacterium]